MQHLSTAEGNKDIVDLSLFLRSNTVHISPESESDA